LPTSKDARIIREAGTGANKMSAARMTYLIIIPAMISVLVPAVGMAFPNFLSSRMALNIALLVSLVFIVSYAAGLAWLALRDHQRISANRISVKR
jgi:Ca2+/H+ antiporter